MKASSGVFSRGTRRGSGGESQDGPQRYRSLAIGHVSERLPTDDRKIEILDLGSACGETLAFYSGLRCKIYFADFYSDLQSEPRDPEAGVEAFVAACERVLPLAPTTRFDLVHAWDLFNYLNLEEIGALAGYLRRYSNDASPLVSLIWTRGRIPAQPNRYAIIDNETVEYRPSSNSERDGPRYKEPVLLRAMSGYRVGRSFLLRHGIQEYIFEPRVSVEAGGGDWGS